MVKNPPASAAEAGDTSLIPGAGRSPGNPLQYSYLKKIQWTEEPGRLQSLGHRKSDITEHKSTWEKSDKEKTSLQTLRWKQIKQA